MKFKLKEKNLEYEFLPAALEITEKPPSPLGRVVVWFISGIIIIAILWASIGKVDEVAVARGKVVPDGRIKVVQPLEEGIVTAIHINEGERVKEGQLLIELDSTMQKANINSLQNSINIIKTEKELLKKILNGEDIEKLASQTELSDDMIYNLLLLNESKNDEYNIKYEALKLEVAQSKSDLEIVEANSIKLERIILMLEDKEKKLKLLLESGGAEESNLQKLQKNIEILKEEEQKYKILYDAGAISKSDWESKYNELVFAEQDYKTQEAKVRQEKNNLEINWKSTYDELVLTKKELETQRLRIEQSKNKYQESLKNLESFEKENSTNIYNLIVEKDKKIIELDAEMTKAKKNMELQSLVSPVNGIVNGLGANTIGGVVSPAQPIMTIVPDGTPLIIEASLLNKDVGFVNVGQKVTIKLDTFPFQKYGTITGEVISISPDAIEDERMGSVYKMKVLLDKTIININNKEVNISPGMMVTVEIKTGKRRIIEFFLEPIIKYADESLKLR